MKEAPGKPQPAVKRPTSLAAALFVGAVVGLPLAAALYLRNRVRKG